MDKEKDCVSGKLVSKSYMLSSTTGIPYGPNKFGKLKKIERNISQDIKRHAMLDQSECSLA